MSVFLRAYVVAAAFLLATGSPAGAEESCKPLRQIASVELGTLTNGLVSIPIDVGGRELKFIVATDGRASTIGAAEANSLGLPREHISGYQMTVADTRLYDFAVANPFKLGQLSGKMRFVILPENVIPTDVSGEVEADFLKNYDVEFDFAKNHINLFLPDHCEGGVIYWTQSAASRVPMQVDAWGAIGIDAELDGKPVHASLATGAGVTTLLISQDEAKFADQASQWKLVKSDQRQTAWFGHRMTIYEHTFKSLALEGIAVSNPHVIIKTIDWPILKPQITIGMDIIRQLHLYIAYKERNLYVTPAGAH